LTDLFLQPLQDLQYITVQAALAAGAEAFGLLGVLS
jgi:hypothetical protein